MDMWNLLESIDIDNKETTELLNYVANPYIDMKCIENTTDRYKRYIEGINDWELGGINYDYIPLYINKFLIMGVNSDDNIRTKISIMKFIDEQLVNIITKHNIL